MNHIEEIVMFAAYLLPGDKISWGGMSPVVKETTFDGDEVTIHFDIPEDTGENYVKTLTVHKSYRFTLV
jgi:hypothetical protein